MKELFRKILRGMDIEVSEASLVFMLLAQSVFLGIFYGAFDPAANSLFLNAFPSDWLPKAFTVSGVAGIALTFVYSKLQSKLTFSKLALFNLLTITVITALLWYGLYHITSRWHVFLILVMMGPLNILAMLGFWGTAGRLFTLRQGKRLFGLIDAGYIIGVILSSYAIPVLLAFHFKTQDLLLICSVSVLIALTFQLIATFRYKELTKKVEKSTAKSHEESIGQLLKNKFVRLMATFVVLSMIIAFFISYSFLAVAKIKYPDINDIAKFFGAFVGTVMIFTLIIKLFVYTKFMKTYGLRTSLLLSPILLVVLTVSVCVVGMAGGYSGSSKGFIFFFLIMSLSRLFSLTLKSSIEAPSFKTLYQTIDSKIRYHVQAAVDGTINEIAAFSSGLILLLMGSLSFIKLINFSQVLVIILITWGWIAFKLYKAYKNNLKDSLTTIKETSVEQVFDNKRIVLNSLSGKEDSFRTLYLLNLQERIQPIEYEKLIPLFIEAGIPEVKKYALEQSDKLHLYHSVEILKKITDEDIKEQSKEVALKIAVELNEGQETERIISLARSKDQESRELAARLIGESKNEELTIYLKALLRDFDNNVRIAAIKAAAKVKAGELAPLLAELLNNETSCNFTSGALIETGEACIDILENLFNKSSNDIVLLKRIVRIMGGIGGEKTISCLVNKINYHNAEIARLAAKMLLSLNYKVDEKNYYVLHQSLMQTMGITAWNIAARASLQSAGEELQLLKQAIKDEVNISFEHLFTLLSLVYDAQSIKYIKENLESEAGESTGYAIELLELVIADDFKPMLFPLIDDTSDAVKVQQLQHFYPVDIFPVEDLIINIINRDYNYMGKWTKACALNYLLTKDKLEITDSIIAQLFNPDELLSELAACIINKNNPEKLNGYFKRLKEANRSRLKISINNYSNSFDSLMFNKILFLKGVECFRKLQGDKLIILASMLEQKMFLAGEEIDSLDSELLLLVHFLVSGDILVTKNDNSITQIGSGQIFGSFFSGPINALPSFIALTDVKVYTVKQEIFDRILFDDPEFSNSLMNFNPIESV